MTPQERDVIAGIFDRLKQAANQPRDPEAENYIAERLREQPYAPYAMAQAVYVQEQALTNLQAQVEQLQGQLRDIEAREAEAQPQSGGFLSGIFGAAPPARPRSVPAFPQRGEPAPSGAWNRQQAVAPGQGNAPGQPEPAAPQPGPWTNQAAARGGGGFMATALTTAAGVAGGMMLGNVLTNAFGGGKAGEAQASQAKASETSNASPSQDTAANTQDAADNTPYNDGSSEPANYQQAAHEEPAHEEPYDDGSSDFGGEDEGWL